MAIYILNNKKIVNNSQAKNETPHSCLLKLPYSTGFDLLDGHALTTYEIKESLLFLRNCIYSVFTVWLIVISSYVRPPMKSSRNHLTNMGNLHTKNETIETTLLEILSFQGFHRLISGYLQRPLTTTTTKKRIIYLKWEWDMQRMSSLTVIPLEI